MPLNEGISVQSSAYVPDLVSVAIPSYNRGYVVAGAIRSALAQTYSPIEIIVVDDGSTDDTRSVVGQFGKDVRYVYQPNGGLGAARNTALDMARGEFVAILDSDDEWLPWKIAAQVEIMRAMPDVGMIWTDMIAVDPHLQLVGDRFLRRSYAAYGNLEISRVLTRSARLGDLAGSVPPGQADDLVLAGDLYSQMFLGNLVHPPTVMLRKSWIARLDPFDATMKWGCDYEFLSRATALGNVALMDTPTMRYRIDAPDQMTRPEKALQAARDNMICVQRFLARSSPPIALPARVKARRLADSYAWLGEAALSAGDKKTAISALGRSALHAPLPRTLAHLLLAIAPGSFYQVLRRAYRQVTATSGTAG